MRSREREFWQNMVAELQENHRKEREVLLERIQRPEFRPIEPGPIVEHDPPKDAQELAYIGREVPEFVQVGTPGEPTEAPIGELVDFNSVA